ncbi:hypothetical protein BD780_004080 [Clostridium tetanomorphum]|uniref:Rhoptry protein n=1 Tax=Clostridium tetanomorphum TaxID=1553 RepID=A0A923ECJ5_CLOTT|nr:hypothetical protein [Clostridium tetanomorphum]KAJ49337.1 hypothetical protein CTM_23634 [Clostridium tetanomorphum DSM 665]KAJ53234.1 hypothetical protein CTM_03049 [Clostridium tetanomorphum DSM 665]MBC2399457.1 hypothetical protein [Clostridium tetanomorphum]MBP1865735.1 hypothetical protein [Clostridium tetanomorphum]NRS86855.1 hypothetical protein [Clostridium tetanomorphum]
MAGIFNINNAYNLNSKRITNKLSFQVGEVFLARMISLDEGKGEVLLRLLDGWQFSAKLKNPLEFSLEGLIKFEVDGFEEGQLQLTILNNKSSEEKLTQDSIENILKGENISVSKEDYVLLEKMVKHNIQLTKENISEVKTLINFINKIAKDPLEEEAFINKYIESRGINLNSDKGREVENILKGFFSQLKELDEDSILTLLENNIDLTEDNIKSFNKVFKEPMSIYKSLEKIQDEWNKSNYEKNLQSERHDTLNKETLQQNKQSVNRDDNKNISNKDMNSKDIINKDTMQEYNKNNTLPLGKNIEETSENFPEKVLKNEEEGLQLNKDTVNEEKVSLKTSQKAETNDIEKNNSTINKNIVENKENQSKDTISKKEIIIKNNIEDLADGIKDKINDKVKEMKDTISNLLTNKSSAKGEAYEKVIQLLKGEVNNFKVFNNISDGYYYMDLPVNINKEDYQCKLIIKDERKKGKKIDRRNVKIATSVTTINMGVVDAFISINNMNMNVDIKCKEQWVKILDKGKDRILKALSDIGYNVYVKVEEKSEDLDIVNCREFFNDENIGAINVKV